MIERLKELHLYSPKTIRDYIFNAISASAKALTAPILVTAFMRQAVNEAEKQAKSDGVDYLHWHAASDGVLNLLLGAGVFLDCDQEPIRPGLKARGTKLSAIADNFEDKSETHMLEQLILHVGDVTLRDRTPIAHALFKVDPKKKSIFDIQDRVDELMALLADRLIEDDQGRLVLDGATPDKLSQTVSKMMIPLSNTA